MMVQGIMKFIQLADDSTQVPNLQKKCYANYRLTATEWTNLDLLCQILKVSTFHDLTQSVSNLINAASCTCSTSILFWVCSHCFWCLPNKWVPTHVTESCREARDFCTNSECHYGRNFKSHQMVLKTWCLPCVCSEQWSNQTAWVQSTDWFDSSWSIHQISIHQEELGPDFVLRTQTTLEVIVSTYIFDFQIILYTEHLI